jgi:pimeloyl-ACP methyl ester carboxylesterase
MPHLSIPSATLHYDEMGTGSPIIFLHGVWMSSRFFANQLPYFSRTHRAIALDFRGHGKSTHVQTGHTMPVYAQDLRNLITSLKLKDVVLVGWSMGAFVIWDYLDQFGAENICATVIVDEAASDFKYPDFPEGVLDFSTLCGMMSSLQTDRKTLVQNFIPSMFFSKPSTSDTEWMYDEMILMPESIASAVFFDQSVRDYRPVLTKISIPTLLCFGRDEKLISLGAAKHLQESIAESKLVIFEKSGHCPFLEESERFNQVVGEFISTI